MPTLYAIFAKFTNGLISHGDAIFTLEKAKEIVTNLNKTVKGCYHYYEEIP